MITTARIRELLPHRYPVLLVDRVSELVPGERLTAVKAVSLNEPWYQYLPPDADDDAYDYPMVLFVESWCQAAGLLASQTCPRDLTGRIPLLGGISDVRILGRVRPGDVVEHRVRLVRDFGDSLIFQGESSVAGCDVMEIGRATIAIRPASAGDPGHPRDPAQLVRR
jgi:3-hydroxyacyl-[acyl-carrier-protein] dehydratase